MKILHVIPSVDARSGGPIEGVKQMGATLQAMGHQVEVASLAHAGAIAPGWLSLQREVGALAEATRQGL